MKPVLFVPSNDTMAYWMPLISKRLAGSKYAIISSKAEGAEDVLIKAGIHYRAWSPEKFDFTPYSAVVLGNDWGGQEYAIVQEARGMRVPTIGVQEGLINPPYTERYRECDMVLVASELWKHELGLPKAVVAGLPITALTGPHMQMAPARVMINCGFAYDVEVELRNEYLRQALQACQGYEHFVSVHPRDRLDIMAGVKWEENLFHKGDAIWVKSNLKRLQGELVSTGVVISRSSTVIYEAMMAGCEVIYFRMGGQTSILDYHPHSALWYPADTMSLEMCVQQAMENYLHPTDMRTVLRQMFLFEHLGAYRYEAGLKCARAIQSYLQELT